ncbi:MAG: hypothetical protein L3J41_15880 [Melioribacteraceae bacterium]|nr:hypothetical protein [Melioribacteraceae bacterium]
MKYLDKEEKELIESFEKGEWISVDNLEKEIEDAKAIAKNSIKKNKRINIRLTEQDYNNIKVQAMEEGLPYQTLISSIIHKYTMGKLKTSS